MNFVSNEKHVKRPKKGSKSIFLQSLLGPWVVPVYTDIVSVISLQRETDFFQCNDYHYNRGYLALTVKYFSIIV